MYTVLLALQYISILVLVLEIVFVLYRRSTKLQNILLVVLVSTLINFVGYLFEMQATTQADALQAVKFIYLGKPFVILFILIFFMERMHIKAPKYLYLVLGIMHLTVSGLVLTCEHHSLFYSSIDYTQEGLFPHLVLGHSAFYMVYHVIILAYFGFMLVVGTRRLRHTKNRRERMQIIYLDALAAVSVIGLLAFFGGVSGGYDTTIPAYLISTLLLLVLITRYDLLDALVLAKENVMDEFADGLIVFDQENDILYANEKVHMIFEELERADAANVEERLHGYSVTSQKIMHGNDVYEVHEKEIIKDGRRYGIIFVVRDVTESYNYALELEEQTAIARKANRAKSDFLAKMSHEIRTPINAVMGMSEMILRESREEGIRHYAVDVQNSANALLGIVNDILDTSKIESGKMEIIPVQYELDSLLNDVISMVYIKAQEKKLELEVIVDEKLPNGLVGDDVRIRQILLNLLNNSVKYTQEGKVTIDVQGHKDGDAMLMHFEVRDTGIGMKEEDLPKLFTAFERIEESKNRGIEGTGLGMSIVFELLKLMGTELKVTSTYGKGSSFSFELRQEVYQDAAIGNFAERSKKLHQVHVYTSSFIAPQAKILLVDDNDVNRKVFCSLLKETGVQIDDVDSGFACLDKIQRQSYDIIFMDHMMPEMDGVETLHRMGELEHKCKDTPVIVLTANAVAGAREGYLKEGFTDYLSKPVNFQKLESLIQKYLPERLVQTAVSEDSGNNGVTRMEDKVGYRSNIRYKILVVDDNPINLQMARKILKDRSQVYTADGGEAAFAVMEKIKPDLVLLDINMPGLNGFQVIERMKCSVALQSIPVIFLTAERSGAVESQCFAAGASDYVTKPFTPGVLISRVERVIALKKYHMHLEDMVETQSEELLKRMEEINFIQREVINSMASLIESRDDSTGNHIKRTGWYVERITHILKAEGLYGDILTEQYLENLLNAAAMHDIGKIKIPDQILQKPGRLTADEFAIMKTHAAEGGNIIRDVLSGIETEDYITVAYDVAVFHHEKWDGTGYPQGKVGEEIPLAARIMALADVYDALSSKRCYKEAMSDEASLAIIRESVGTHFDPAIANAVLKHWDYFVSGVGLETEKETEIPDSAEMPGQTGIQESDLPASLEDAEIETVQQEEAVELPELAEFDWDFARQYFHDDQMLIQTIRDICMSMDSDMEELQNWYDEFTAEEQSEEAASALEHYRIRVHAVKGNMAMIGAMLMSKLARLLELAAIQGDISRIRQVHSVFMEEMYAHKCRMEPLTVTHEEKQEADLSGR
ncbi:MAG: response regulator [Lachnospiraceae bacterium]|nr:response regulator [Lachnospiraceae bacterium]